MVIFKQKSDRSIKYNKKKSITLDGKHQEFLNEFSKDTNEKIPELKNKIKICEEKIKSGISLEESLDLKDKIAKQGISGKESSLVHNITREEALSALTMLGFSKNIVNKAIDRELKNQSNLEVEELVKRVLKNL